MKNILEEVEFAPVESSNIAAVAHHAETHTLLVEYKSGDTYLYLGVEKEIHAGLLAAESAGKYLNQNVKTQYYPFAKLSRQAA